MSEEARTTGPTSRLERLARRAGAIIVFERLWPVAIWVASIFALFLAASWLGLWLELPRAGRIVGVLVFVLALAAALVPLVRFRTPSRRERLARLDRDAGLPHRPATALDDTLANASDDPATRALWDLHRRRLERTASSLRLGPPSPRMVERDRYALRAAALLALGAAAVIAGPEKYPRLLAAFDWETPGAISQGFRVDAWIDPPAYTGRPPIMLTGRDKSEQTLARIQAPVGSTIVVRSGGTGGLTIEPGPGLVPVDPAKAPAASGAPAPTAAAPANDASDQRWTLRGDGSLVLRRYGSSLASFDLAAIPDKPPVVTLLGEPRNNVRGSLTLRYKLDDDYGVIGAEAQVSKPLVNGKPVTGRPLVEPPRIPLALPTGSGGTGEAETTADLAESPWAGAKVTLTLAAKDEGGNTGFSTPVEMTLPQRSFTKPLARALVEERRNLVLAPETRARVHTAMDALMIEPELFGTNASVYLGLRTIARRLERARSDDDLRSTADFMWEMALRLEDGDLSQAERDLRAAQQALREAMQRNASPEELRQLMDQLRAAMDKFLNEMAQQQQQNGQQRQAQSDPNAKVLTPQDLQSMLDRMEDMAKNGDMADAQRMLDDLQNMLENLQSAQGGEMDPAQQEMNQALDDLDRMTRDQKDLRDRTYRQSQKQHRDGQPNTQRRRQNGQQAMPGQPQPGDEDMQDQDDGDQSADKDQDGDSGDDQQSLQQKQQQLRQRLQDLKNKMKQFGMKGSPGFDDAEGAMKEAEEGIGQGKDGQGRAVDAQGRALEGLRRGAQQLAQQMQQNGQGQEGGAGNPGQGSMRQGQNGRGDPLGRDMYGRVNPQSRYDPMGAPAAQRAQRVLEELRRRLGNTGRPQEELDYLERLLRPY